MVLAWSLTINPTFEKNKEAPIFAMQLPDVYPPE